MANQAHNKQIISWALYDWANSAFATTVMAGLFPLFYKEYWHSGVSNVDVSFRLGLSNSIASLFVALMAPVLGAIADQGSSKKKFLMFFAMMGILMTSLLFLVAKGGWLVASLLYIFALIGFSGGNIFYDALLVNVAGGRRVDIISGLGYALGYLGGGILFAINIWMISNPDFFGLRDASHAVRWSFLTVAIWWALFSIPVFIFVKEPALQGQPKKWAIIRAGLQQLLSTLKSIASYKTVLLFLLAYWFYIDGVDTVVRMAVDYGLSLGLDSKKLLLALLLAQLVGFPSALAFGYLGQWIGPKKGIYIGLIFYIVVLLWATGISSNQEFYMLAVAIGLVQGGIQALSRSLYVRIIPKDKAGEFFGFYNIFGKFAAVLGPVLMGTVGLLSGDPRKGLLAIIFLFIIGGVFLYFVNYDKSNKN